MKQVMFLKAGLLVAALSPALGWGAARLTVEAETATIAAPMRLVCKDELPAGAKYVPGAAGDAYLEIPQGAGNPPQNTNGWALLEVNVPADSDYILWGRVHWDDECGNSFMVQIDGQTPFLFGENATFKTWHWVRYPVARTARPLRLTKGTHTIRFLNREDGVRLDQVLLSADKRFVPVGQERVGVVEP